MKSKIRRLVITVCICFISLSYAFAEDEPMEKCPMEMMGMRAMKKMDDKMDFEDKFYRKIHFILMRSAELGVSDQQVEQIQTLKYKTKKSLILKDAEIEGLGLDIMDALRKENVDVNAVNKIIDRKYEVKKQKAKELVNADVQLRTTLTAEQRNKLKETPHTMGKMKMEHGSKMHHSMGDSSVKKE